MNLIVCLDDNNGMLFNGRRQSKDALLRMRVLRIAGEKGLWLNTYSAKQFEESATLHVCEDYLRCCEENDFCFVEDTDIRLYKDKIRFIYVYRWNRVYPADTWFPFDALCGGKSPESVVNFPGNSHEMITEEVYRL